MKSSSHQETEFAAEPLPQTATRKLHVFPGWFSTNPYLNLLYLDARAQGFDVIGYTDLLLFLRSVKSAKAGEFIHLHWTSPIAQDADSAKTARSNLKLLEKSLRSAKQRKVKLIWTIHNAIPHETKYFDIEVELCKMLCDVVDSIHVLADNTARELAELYTLPEEKVVKVAHSSYWGVYDQSVSKSAARAQLGVNQNETTAVILGRNRGYKGIDKALGELISSAIPEAPLTVLIASELSKKDIEVHSLPKHVRVLAADHFLDADELATWLTAADFAVFAFDKILNSGSAFLATTFGLPFAAPALGNLPEAFLGQPFAKLYEPETDGLRVAIDELIKDHEKLSASAIEFATANKPYDMAVEFRKKLLSE